MQAETLPATQPELTAEQWEALDKLRSDVITFMGDLYQQDTKRALQLFQTELNKPCAEQFLQKERNHYTLPISYVEAMLDAYYLGQWQVVDFRFQVVVNEVIGSIILEVTNPVSGETVRRTGAASVQIMVNKGANFTDVSQKKPNALEMGFPKLKSMCLKNAAKSLGKRFGRELNRKHTAQNFEVVKTNSELLGVIMQPETTSHEG